MKVGVSTRKTDISGHVVVDGGILSNFPIELFVSDQPPITNVMGPKQDIPTIGMLIQIRNPPALLVRIDKVLPFPAWI